MAARAVVFDVGGVLERPVAPAFAGRWERRLDLGPGELAARLRRSGLGRAANLGRVSEAAFACALGELYGLDEAATGELLGDLWDWYVGEPNTELAGYLRGLRSRCRTAILSNAAAGGHRVERARYRFDDLEANVSGARAVGMSAVLFEHTAQAIAGVEAWLSAGGGGPGR